MLQILSSPGLLITSVGRNLKDKILKVHSGVEVSSPLTSDLGQTDTIFKHESILTNRIGLFEIQRCYKAPTDL